MVCSCRNNEFFTKRHDDDCGSKFLKNACNAIAAAKRGFTADTGVYHLVIELVPLDALLE